MNQLPDDDPEVKKLSAVYASEISQEDPMEGVIKRISSWSLLKKIISWILRFKTNLLHRVKKRKAGQPIEIQPINMIPLITVSELMIAEAEIIKHVQGLCFRAESLHLQQDIRQSSTHNHMVLKKGSSIYKLDPILKKGLICVGGRLQRAPIDCNLKHPIILPKSHHVVDLIIRYYHHISGHFGLEYTLSLIRQKYWVVNGRQAVKKVLRDCFICGRRQASVAQQKMEGLPKDRITPSRPPFTYIGVDCFGPFSVKRGRSHVKRYGVLFTCLAIRAVNIEVAGSLDTASFVNALRRFIARRGQPEEMRSDNGGNFVKGEKELREAVRDWNQSQIHEFLLQRNIKWTFNPPAGSHHGGVVVIT